MILLHIPELLDLMKRCLELVSLLIKRNRGNYTPDFKPEAIGMVEETDDSIAQVSRGLSIGSKLIAR